LDWWASGRGSISATSVSKTIHEQIPSNPFGSGNAAGLRTCLGAIECDDLWRCGCGRWERSPSGQLADSARQYRPAKLIQGQFARQLRRFQRGGRFGGGGLQAGFQLEQKFDASSGANDPEGAFARNSNVWLGGSWGRVTLGRANTPSYNAMASWDLMSARNNSISNQTFGIVGESERQSDQISYRTPQLGGVIVEVAYVPKDSGLPNGIKRSKIDLGATYTLGTLKFGAAYNKSSDLDANFAFGAKYQYQNIEFAGGYYQARNGRYFNPNNLQFIPNAVYSSNGFNFGAKANWHQFSAGIDVARHTKSEYSVGGSNFGAKKYTGVSLNGTYALSKRTSTYINYMRLFGLNNYGAGLMHSF
jgi:predicted porin